jgi:hypothetical protein
MESMLAARACYDDKQSLGVVLNFVGILGRMFCKAI